MGQFRLQRLGEQLREEIATMILRHEIKDPRVNEFLSVNRVEVAADLAYAKVYVSSFSQLFVVLKASKVLPDSSSAGLQKN